MTDKKCCPVGLTRRCGGRGRGVASALGHLCQLHVVSPEGLRSSVCAATIPHLLSSATGLPCEAEDNNGKLGWKGMLIREITQEI